MSLGINLRTLIDEREITQKELAHQLNIAPSTLGSYVQDAREPDFNTLKSLAEYFNVSIDFSHDQTENHQEDELLRIFRSLSPEQKEICLEQCKVFVRMNHKEKLRKSS
ncbi:MAG: helix-turn-helix domain-containing protein [Clostridiales bacterium]|nr:helix-turn-helix domain-containing protein [Clostridiales bacterium]